jgi:tetratricopeptide (TPR) repeat protein
VKPESGGFFQTGNSLGILGNPFWENFVVVLDYKFQRMLLKSSSVLKVRSDIEKAIDSGDRALIERREFRGAEAGYQRALAIATANGDRKNEARVLGRIGNLRRIMAKDLSRPEHSKAAYDYYVKAQELAKKAGATEIEGRILGDWSLLYLEGGQMDSAKQTMDRALVLAPQDPDVNVDCAVHLSRARRFPTPKMISTLKEIVRYFPWSKVAQDKLRQLEPTNAPPNALAPAPAAAPPAVRTLPPTGAGAQQPNR